MSEEQIQGMEIDPQNEHEERLAISDHDNKPHEIIINDIEHNIPEQFPNHPTFDVPSSPEYSSQNCSPSQNYMPKEISADGVYNLAAFMQMQGRISTEEFTYLHKIASLIRTTEQKLETVTEKIQNARAILDEDLAPLNQENLSRLQNQGQQINVMELFEIFKATMMQQNKEVQEPPKSYLIKKGDEHEIKEMQDREEVAKKSNIVGSTGTIENQPISKEEMDIKRRERAAMLQKQQEDSAREREEMERKTKAREAFFKNDGNTRIGRS